MCRQVGEGNGGSQPRASFSSPVVLAPLGWCFRVQGQGHSWPCLRALVSSPLACGGAAVKHGSVSSPSTIGVRLPSWHAF